MDSSRQHTGLGTRINRSGCDAVKSGSAKSARRIPQQIDDADLHRVPPSCLGERMTAVLQRTSHGYRKYIAMWLAPWLIACAFADLHAGDSSRPYLVFEKTNEIVLDVGPPGSFDSTQAKYPCVQRVGDEWWMWYNGRTDDRFAGSIGLATSRNGLQWTKRNHGKPVFRHGPDGAFDATKVDHPAVLFFEDRFHMWYTAGDAESRYTIGYATSRDGIEWTRANEARPVLTPGRPGQFDDQLVLHPAVVRDETGLLHMWYNGVGPQESFRVGHAVSRDGVHWERENRGLPVLEPHHVDEFEEGYVYNVFVMREEGMFHMWYSAWTTDGRVSGPNHNGITHAVSRDGNRWVRDDTPTLTNGVAGSLDDYACFACWIIRGGDEFRMYYSAASGGADGVYRVCLATCALPE